MATSFTPIYGTSSQIKRQLSRMEAGQFIVATDVGKIYLDVSSNKRILVGQTKSVEDLIKGTFVADGWKEAEDDGYVFQTITNSKVTGKHPLIIDLIVSSDIDVGTDEQNEWAKISRIVAGAGTITAYCYDTEPKISLNFQAKEV